MARKQSNANDPRAQIVHLAQSGVQLTTRQAAIYVGLTERTLETYRDIGKPPHYVKIGHHIRYPVQFLEEFLRASTPSHSLPHPKILHALNEVG